MKENKSLRGAGLLALIVIGHFLWPSVLVWPAVAHSQQETHWPTHYVIVVRNTSPKAYSEAYRVQQWIDLISRDKIVTAIDSIPRGLAAASGQIPLWRKPEPGDLISVVFAAAGKDPKPPDQRGCESPHYPGPSGSDERIRLKLDEYFDVRKPIVIEEHDSPSDIADPSSKLHDKLIKSLAVGECDLIANAYSEALTLAKGLAAVEIGDANGEEKYKHFFLLVFDFASPAYGSTKFNREFDVPHEDLAPGTPAYFIASIGSLKFADGEWNVDVHNYLDYPADEPGGTTAAGERDTTKFYPRIRFYRAIAHEAHSDPFYGLANAQRETERLNLKVAQLEHERDQREKEVERIEEDLETARTIGLVAGIAAATFAVLMVFITWQWWASKGRARKAEEEHQKELQQMREDQSILAKSQERHFEEYRLALAEEFRKKQAASEAEKEKLKSQLRNAICIPDAHKANEASEFA